MVIQSPRQNVHYNNNAVLVDSVIGDSAYGTVRFVAKNIEYIKHVSAFLAQIYRVNNTLDAIEAVNLKLQLLEDIHAVLPDLVDISAELISIRAYVDTLTEQLIAIGDNLIETAATINDRIDEIESHLYDWNI